LRKAETSLVEIALQCGFSSQSHFTTVFRRLVGTTPAGYRASLVL
jgi:AraC family transcriptional regulator